MIKYIKAAIDGIKLFKQFEKKEKIRKNIDLDGAFDQYCFWVNEYQIDEAYGNVTASLYEWTCNRCGSINQENSETLKYMDSLVFCHKCTNSLMVEDYDHR